MVKIIFIVIACCLTKKNSAIRHPANVVTKYANALFLKMKADENMKTPIWNSTIAPVASEITLKRLV